MERVVVVSKPSTARPDPNSMRYLPVLQARVSHAGRHTSRQNRRGLAEKALPATDMQRWQRLVVRPVPGRREGVVAYPLLPGDLMSRGRESGQVCDRVCY